MIIPQEDSQVNSQEGTPDETAAVLSFATKLSEGLLPKAQQPQETGPTSAPQQQNDIQPTQQPKIDLETNNKEMEKMMDAKIEEMKKDIKDTIKEEISGIKESIEEAIKENG